jgi:hypothetical protein
MQADATLEESKDSKTVDSKADGGKSEIQATLDTITGNKMTGEVTLDEGPEPILDINGAIFERMIIIVPYKSPEIVKHVEAIFERINLTGLNLENSRYLNVKELSEDERADRTLDYLGGFEIMDSEFRMFIIEGLGGRGHGMDQFYKANERTRPNDKKFRMLYNP